MKLLFKERFFSWFDSYDIYDENGNTVYTVKGELAWGKKLQVYDAAGEHIGTLKEKIQFIGRPRFEIYIRDNFAGIISKRITFFKPTIDVEYLGWYVEGDFFEWDYCVYGSNGDKIATVSKELFKLTDTYVIDVADPSLALNALMLVIAIDAEKDNRN